MRLLQEFGSEKVIRLLKAFFHRVEIAEQIAPQIFEKTSAVL